MYVARLKLANERAPEVCAKMLQVCLVRKYKDEEDEEDEEEDLLPSTKRSVSFISKPCPTSMAQFTWLSAFHVVLWPFLHSSRVMVGA